MFSESLPGIEVKEEYFSCRKIRAGILKPIRNNRA
jgi:hypothetical protein